MSRGRIFGYIALGGLLGCLATWLIYSNLVGYSQYKQNYQISVWVDAAEQYYEQHGQAAASSEQLLAVFPKLGGSKAQYVAYRSISSNEWLLIFQHGMARPEAILCKVDDGKVNYTEFSYYQGVRVRSWNRQYDKKPKDG